MNIYVSVTREPAEPRDYLTPVAAVHVALPHGDKIGVKTFKGENMWKDLHADLCKVCGRELPRFAPSNRVIPCGWNAGMQWGIIMTNFFRCGLSFYDYMQPTTKKWQNTECSDISRIFSQCAYIKDVTVSEEDAFKFMGMENLYYSEDMRFECVKSEDPACEQAICMYMQGLFDIHRRYAAINPVWEH